MNHASPLTMVEKCVANSPKYRVLTRHGILLRVVALNHLTSGKVRDIYEIDEGRLLMVASDRISAYDVVLDEAIPDKGRVLTSLSEFWFSRLSIPHHFLTSSLHDIGLTESTRADLEGRAMVVRRAEVIPVECVVRGYLYGSSWREYRDGGGPTTEHLPSGLIMADLLEEPIFTPATKAETGHDENLTEQGSRDILGDELYELLKKQIDGAVHHGSRARSQSEASCWLTRSSSSATSTERSA